MGIMPKKVTTNKSATATKAKTTTSKATSKAKKSSKKETKPVKSVPEEVQEPVQKTVEVVSESVSNDSQTGGDSTVQNVFSELVNQSDVLLKQQKKMTSNLKKVFKSYQKECK